MALEFLCHETLSNLIQGSNLARNLKQGLLLRQRNYDTANSLAIPILVGT